MSVSVVVRNSSSVIFYEFAEQWKHKVPLVWPMHVARVPLPNSGIQYYFAAFSCLFYLYIISYPDLSSL